MLIKDGTWRLANLNLWWSKWSAVAQTRLFSYFHWLMDSCYHISCLVGPIATGWFSYSRLSHLGCPKFGKAMPWHQSQIRLPMFQHIQILSHQSLTPRQTPLTKFRSPGIWGSQPLSLYQLSVPPTTTKLVYPPSTFQLLLVTTSILLIPCLNGTIPLWVMRELLPQQFGPTTPINTPL